MLKNTVYAGTSLKLGSVKTVGIKYMVWHVKGHVTHTNVALPPTFYKTLLW